MEKPEMMRRGNKTRKHISYMKGKSEKGNHGQSWVRTGRAVGAKERNLEDSETQLNFVAVAIVIAIIISLNIVHSRLWFWRINRMALFNMN